MSESRFGELQFIADAVNIDNFLRQHNVRVEITTDTGKSIQLSQLSYGGLSTVAEYIKEFEMEIKEGRNESNLS